MIRPVDRRRLRVRMGYSFPERIHVKEIRAVQRYADKGNERTVDQTQIIIQPVLRALPAIQRKHRHQKTKRIQKVREF